MRRVALATLGCRLNQVDTQELQAALEARGYETVELGQPGGEAPDVCVINTCAVTARAEFSDRQLIRQAARRHPGARVVVTGCWAQTNPEAVARVRGVDLVAGNADKARLADLVDDLVRGGAARDAGRGGSARLAVSDVERAPALGPARLAPAPGRSRAFVKVQDGCRHRCAFCIVPLARGRSRSRPPEAVLEQVTAVVEAGHPEVVLTGVDLGAYGADLVPRTSLAALVARLVEVRGLRWLRLSSVLPAYFTPALLEVATGSPVVAPHFHVPLQSGSDRVLRRMRRPYTVAMYRRLVERLAAAVPDLGLGTDVIAGFPGERDDDFAATLALVEALPFTYLHVFPYSDRAGTEAASLSGRLPARVVTERAARLRAVGGVKARAFREGLVGSVREVLVLETRDRATGGLVGLTSNYAEVVFEGPDELMRRLVPVRVVDAGAERARGVRE